VFGENTVKQKQSVKGHVWIDDRLFPRLMFYAFFFVGILSVEAVIATARLLEGEKLQYDFVLLVTVTAVTFVLFLLEGTLSTRRRTSPVATKS
jgi:hypothetical protein